MPGLYRQISVGPTLRSGSSSRVGKFQSVKDRLVRLFNERRVFHRPRPEPTTDKGAVEAIRKWLEENGVNP